MAKTGKTIFTFQDIVHYITRYFKYGKIAVLMFLMGILVALLYYTYGQPTYYSRSQVAFTNLTLPITSETADVAGKGRYAQISFMVISALNSRWIIEETAKKLGLIDTVGQYEVIRDNYVPKVSVSMLPGNILQIEVYAYQPRLVREWPEAMIEAYRDYTVESRSRHRKMATETYTSEMEKLREQIDSDQMARAKYEEDHKLIEQYIEHNSLEGVPSEMLNIKSRLDTMQQVDSLLANSALPTVEKLSLLKKFRGTPVPVGSIMRQGEADTLITRTGQLGSGGASSIVSSAPTLPGVPAASPGGPGAPGAAPVIVVPSMVEELEPWEKTERELRAAMFEREQASRTYLPGHQIMRTLDKRIENLKAALESEQSTAVNSFQLERAQLKQQLEELQKKMPDYRRVLSDFDRYKKEYNLMTGGNMMWETAYADLQKRLTAMEYTGIDMKVEFDFKGFTMMRDDVPVSPNKSKLLTYALLLGLGCAGGTCFGLEHLRSTTSLVTETEKMTGLSALGVVPICRSSWLLDPFAKEDTESDVNLAETFRIIRCSIPLHVARDNKFQVIMVTSSRPSEGKTTVSSLLARSFADAGQKTILIDADLRRGRVHRLLNREQNAGLAGYLSGEVEDINELLVPTPAANLKVLTRGKYSEPRFEALGSDHFIETIAELRKQYDRIIIDTPPLLGLADSLMVSGCTDGAVIVVRADQTTQRDIRTALEIVQVTRKPIYGFVLNGVDLSSVENYYYYSSYYPKYYDPSYTEVRDD